MSGLGAFFFFFFLGREEEREKNGRTPFQEKKSFLVSERESELIEIARGNERTRERERQTFQSSDPPGGVLRRAVL